MGSGHPMVGKICITKQETPLYFTATSTSSFSNQVGTLKYRSMIKVDQVYGNRVHVCYPTQGWVDMTYICIAQARPTLVLRDLPIGTNEIILRNYVQRQGWRSGNVKVVTGKYMGRRTCVAFCEFATHDFAEQAKKIAIVISSVHHVAQCHPPI